MSRPERDPRSRKLRPIALPRRIYARVEHGRVFVHDLFDGKSVDVPITSVYDVNFAIELNDVPVALETRDVSGEEPSVANSCRRQLRIVPVTCEESFAIDLEASD